jgi:hypothetical protein
LPNGIKMMKKEKAFMIIEKKFERAYKNASLDWH